MGKNKGGKGGKSGYVHKHNHNEKAHGSDERRIVTLKRLKVKQLQGHVDKQLQRMHDYLPDDVRERMNARVNPEYALMGAARVAREHYRDPNDRRHLDDQTPVDLIETFGRDGMLWTHSPNGEGRVLLTSMLRLAVGHHNITEHTSDACKVRRKYACVCIDMHRCA